MQYIPIARLSASIGLENVKKLLRDFPGGRLYIPKNYINRTERNRAIIEAYYAGATREELAAAYELSVSTIDNIKNSVKNDKSSNIM